MVVGKIEFSVITILMVSIVMYSAFTAPYSLGYTFLGFGYGLLIQRFYSESNARKNTEVPGVANSGDSISDSGDRSSP